MLTIELVSSDRLASVCLICGRVYKHVAAGYQVSIGEASSGYCPDHPLRIPADQYRTGHLARAQERA
jgi:hypothetical protein